MTKKHLLFLTIFLEGYIVLACEILALRLLIPHVGSGTQIAAIVIGFVLLPLAAGYHYGGNYYSRTFKKARNNAVRLPSVRRKLLSNFLIAQFFLAFGLSSAFLEYFFSLMTNLGLAHLSQTTVYAVLFLIAPVFALGQTIPLVSHYFLHGKLSTRTGNILFASTMGSFLGAIVAPLLLMTHVGVNVTALITLGLLVVLSGLVGRKEGKKALVIGVVILIVSYFFNVSLYKQIGMVADNAYNTTFVFEDGDRKILNINGSYSAALGPAPEDRFPYRAFIEDRFITPFMNENPPRKILVLGAGGFTIGLNDTKSDYTFIDIDAEMKDVAEKYFLKHPVSPNKKFVAESARSFIHRDKTLYDLIVLDVFTMKESLPIECITREFLHELKKHLAPNGIVALNIIADPLFRDRFSVRYNNTFASVFPAFNRLVMGQRPEDWDARQPKGISNLLYFYINTPMADDGGIYTDNKNSYEEDMDFIAPK